MKMTYLNKVLYRMYVERARIYRKEISTPSHHCIFTGLDFNPRTRTASYWQLLNRIAALRICAGALPTKRPCPTTTT